MAQKKYNVLADGKLRNVAYEFLKDKVTLWHQQTEKFSQEKFAELLSRAEGLYSVSDPEINEDFLLKAPKLKTIAQLAVGYDNIDLVACANHNVRVSNTRGTSSDAVADLAYGLIIDCARHITKCDAFIRSGQWGLRKSFGLTNALAGKTLGIIGMGQIGSAIARRAVISKMNVIYYNPHRRSDEKELQATYCDMTTLLHSSDFTVLACSLNSQTANLINKETLALMKPSAALINISRGKVVNSDDLYDALVQQKLGYAALDVLDPEPIGADHKLLTLPNITVTPHVGNATKETRDAMALLAAQNLVAGLNGETMPTELKIKAE